MVLCTPALTRCFEGVVFGSTKVLNVLTFMDCDNLSTSTVLLWLNSVFYTFLKIYIYIYSDMVITFISPQIIIQNNSIRNYS